MGGGREARDNVSVKMAACTNGQEKRCRGSSAGRDERRDKSVVVAPWSVLVHTGSAANARMTMNGTCGGSDAIHGDQLRTNGAGISERGFGVYLCSAGNSS